MSYYQLAIEISIHGSINYYGGRACGRSASYSTGGGILVAISLVEDMGMNVLTPIVMKKDNKASIYWL